MKAVRPLCLLLSLTLLAAPAGVRGQRARRDPVEQRIDALLRRMTLEEKLGQLQQLDGDWTGTYRPEHPDMIRRGRLGSTLNVRGAARTNELQRVAVNESRLKIPHLFAFDVIHGYRTVFPIPLGEAASWDTAAAERAAHIAATEARAAFSSSTSTPSARRSVCSSPKRWTSVRSTSRLRRRAASGCSTARTRPIGDSTETSACSPKARR